MRVRNALSFSSIFFLASALLLPTSPAWGNSLAEAEEALEENRFAEAARAFSEAASDESEEDALSARAYRGEAAAHLARLEIPELMRALELALATDPDFPGNAALVRVLRRTAHRHGRPEDWTDRISDLSRATEDTPHLRSQITCMQITDLTLSGRFDDAWARSRELFPPEEYLVIGPFANIGGSGIDEVYPPEVGVDPEATYQDLLGRPITWFEGGTYPPGRLDFDVLLDDPANAVAYALTHVKVRRATAAHACLSGSGAFRLWVNGELCLDESLVRAAGDPLYEVPVRLEKGWNRVLVKGGAEQERLHFYLRFTHPDGRPLELETSIDPDVYEAEEEEQGRDGEEVSLPRGIERYSEESWLRRWARGMDEAPLADQAFFLDFLVERGFRDEAREAIERAEELFGGSALIGDLRSKLLAQESPGEATAVIRELARSAPEHLRARLALIMDLLGQGEGEEAWRETEAAVADFPRDPSLRTVRASLLTNRGSVSEGLEELARAFEENPDNLFVRNLYLQILKGQNKDRLYREEVMRAHEARPDDWGHTRRAAAIAFKRGDFEEALELLDHALRAGERADKIWYERAAVLEADDRNGEAIEALEEGLRRAPMSRSLTEYLGTVLLREGREEEALTHLRRHVELDPTSFDVRDMITNIEGGPSRRELFPPVDRAELAARDLTWVDAKDAAVYLLLSSEVIQYPDGAYQRWHHSIMKVLTPGGVELYRKSEVPPAYAGGDVEIARTIKPDGSENEAEEAVGEVAFPDLEPGDLIELRYVVDVGPSPGLPGHFWHSHYFQYEVPCLLSRFSLLLPEETEYRSVVHNLDLTPTRTEVGDWRLDVWETRELGADAAESFMPPPEERVAWLDVSTIPSWEAVVEWYAKVSRGALRSRPPIASLGEEFSAGDPPDSVVIRRAAHYALQNIQYEGGSFVESAYVPRSAHEVLRTRYGDCKDQAGLIISLLGEMGISAHFALVNSRDEMTVPYLPSPRFTHAIVRARTDAGRIFWIDPTSKGLAFPNIPIGLEGAQALVIDREEPAFVMIEEEPSGTNGNLSLLEAVVNEEGDLKVSGTCRFEGEDAHVFRLARLFLPEYENEMVKDMVVSQHPGAVVSDIALEASEDLDIPVELSYRFERDAAASFAAGLMILEPPWIVGRVPYDLVSLEAREEPLVLDSWKGQYREEVTLWIPEGFHPVADLPPVDLTCSVGRFSRAYAREEDGAIRMEKELVIDMIRVEPQDYAEFREFLKEAWRAEEAPIVLQAAE